MIFYKVNPCLVRLISYTEYDLNARPIATVYVFNYRRSAAIHAIVTVAIIIYLSQ